MLTDRFTDVYNDAQQLRDQFPESTWEASLEQKARLFYRVSVVSRSTIPHESEFGRENRMRQAECAIAQAEQAMPGDPEIQREKQRVLQCKRREDARRRGMR